MARTLTDYEVDTLANALDLAAGQYEILARMMKIEEPKIAAELKQRSREVTSLAIELSALPKVMIEDDMHRSASAGALAEAVR